MRTIVCVLAFVAACGKKTGDDPHPGSGSDPGSGAGSAPAELGTDPTLTLVKQAFGGKLPAFPLLSKDGATAAFGVASPIGGSDVSTYAVAFFSGWTGSGDAWGSNAQPAFIVDATMAKMLLDSAMGEGAPRPDPAVLKTRADELMKRLTDFTPFVGATAKLGVGETTVGPVKVRVDRDPEGGIVIGIASQNAVIPPHPIKPLEMGHVADVDCVSQPVARNAWYDKARNRLLVEVDWNAGPDACSAPDPELGLIAVP